MKKMRFIALIAAMAAICTGCGTDTSDADSKNDVTATSATTAVSETTTAETTSETTAETTAETTSSDSTATTAATTSASDTKSEANNNADTATKSNNTQTETPTEHSADDPANKGGHEPTYEMEQYAVNGIDALNNVLAMFGGKGLGCDESDTITADIDGENIIFSKVSADNPLNFTNTDDVKNYMKLSLPESEYNKYMLDFDRHFRDENGSLYMNTNVGIAFYSFSCDTDDMIITDITGDTFTVTYKEANQMFGMGYVYFQKDGGRWEISGFEFK